MQFKLKTIILAISCILFFCSCKNAIEIPLTKPYVTEINISPQVVHLDIDEDLENQLFSSAAFQEAQERNSIILFDDEVITDGESSKQIVEEFLKRKRATFFVYKFYSENNAPLDAICYVYNKDKKKIDVASTLCKNWKLADDFEDYESIHGLKIDEYGYLVASQYSTNIISNKVIHNSDLEPHIQEMNQLYDIYLEPIYMDLCEELFFTHSDNIGTQWLGLIDSLYRHSHSGVLLNKAYPDHIISLEDAYQIVSPYFDMTIEEFETYLLEMPRTTSIYYSQSDNALFCSTERGGSYPHMRVIKHEKQNNIMEIVAQLYDRGGEPIDDKIFIRICLNPDGTFYYVSVTTHEKMEYLRNLD